MHFLLSWDSGLAAHGSDADYRKSSDPDEDIRHYIDIDNYPEFLSSGYIAQDFDSLAAVHGRDFIMLQGILPWTIIQTTEALTAAFKSQQWDKAMLIAADLGHYVGDAHMPLHLTRNYNGQYTNQKGVHSRIESKMIDRYANEITITGKRAACIPSISDYTFRMIYDNYACVDSVLIADSIATALARNTWDTVYYEKLWQLCKPFTIRLLEDASYDLASLIYTCWVHAGSPNPATHLSVTSSPTADFTLHQNYPNPFNAQTTISYTVQKPCEISIVVFNARGEMVVELFKGIKAAGHHRITWNAENAGTGLYIIQTKAGDYLGTTRCLLIK